MPVNSTDIGSPSYFTANSIGVWGERSSGNLRFVIEGDLVNAPMPLPAGAAFLLTGLAGLALLRRRRR